MVDAYIALSEFSRHKFVAGGLPPDRIVVKPNFIGSDPGVGKHTGKFGLFVGRLAPEKGVGVLQKAWGRIGQHTRLKVIGSPVDGENPASQSIEYLGPQPKERVYAEMKEASFLVFPSECYENCPMTIIEAFATGLPVIVSGLGSAAEMVLDHQAGLHFRAGDSSDLAAKVEWVTTHPEDLVAMGQRAREEFNQKYTAEGNYSQLMDVYRFATAGMSPPSG
jgi:glycosyltransferase involved in cell wall biosynthesis